MLPPDDLYMSGKPFSQAFLKGWDTQDYSRHGWGVTLKGAKSVIPKVHV